MRACKPQFARHLGSLAHQFLVGQIVECASLANLAPVDISPQTLAFPSDAIAMAEPLRAFFAIRRASSSSPNILSRVVSTSRESRALRTAIRTPTKYTGPSHTNPT